MLSYVCRCILHFYESYSDRDIHKVIYKIKNSLNRKKFEYMLVPCFGVYRILDNHIPITNACEMAGYAHKSKETKYQ